jgi:hypothetical protein
VNHFVARQRRDGRWDYTCNGYPTGYCTAYRELEESMKSWFTEKQIEELRVAEPKHHDCGHPTKAEAEECYKRYILDQRLHLDSKDSSSQHKCQVCGEWTQNFATVGGWSMFILCDAHNNRAEIEKLYNVTESWES